MLDRELAQRLVSYADAVVAINFVTVSAFGLAVADPDIRCTLVGGKSDVLIANAIIGVAFSVLLLFLRRWELALGGEDSLSALGKKYSRYLNVGRYGLIWVTLLLTNYIIFSIDRTGCAG